MYLSGLVLGNLVLGVLAALLALAVGASGLWNVDLRDKESVHNHRCAISLSRCSVRV
jgi:hypothetical protein